MRSPEPELVGDTLTLAACGTKEDVRRKRPHVSTDMSARSAEAHIARVTALERRSEALKLRGDCLQYTRQLIWDSDKETIGPTALYSLTADPLPRPPLSA